MNTAQHFGQYDHGDRGLLILGIFVGIVAIVYLVNKFIPPK
jgi:hypothetical protein